MKKQSGFTLIELLLVLAIIGIISAIAIPALVGQKEKANRRATEGTYNSLITECQGAAKTPGITAASVITYVTGLKNFTYPNTKNPYAATSAGIVPNAVAGANGQVGLIVSSVVGPDGVSVPAIRVTYKHKGGSAAQWVTVE